MSYLRRYKVQCGRHTKKPFAHDDEYDDENDDMQTQIDNLRAKISLKERYNKALREELQESNAGASQMIKSLLVENDYLRIVRNDAVKSGQTAASRAIRSDRIIQLTLNGKEPFEVLDWLDDKIFDLVKKLDEKAYQFGLIKKKLLECEQMVDEMDKYSFPGSQPWEQVARAELDRIGVDLAKMESLRDVAKILNMKYREISQELKDERDAWPYAVLALEAAYEGFKNELIDLEHMLEDAIRLRDGAYYRLVMTEKEFAENRKARKRQMARMKRAVEQGLQVNARRWKKVAEMVAKSSITSQKFSKSGWMADIAIDTIRDLKYKQAKVQEYEERAKLLVEAMRVPNLTYCPRRLHTVRMILEQMLREAIMKVALRDMLIKQKANLFLIYNHLKYTGDAQQLEYEKRLKAHYATKEEFEIKKKNDYRELNNKGLQLLEAYKFCVDCDNLLNLGKYKTPHPRQQHEKVNAYMKVVVGKIKVLLAQIEALRGLFDPAVEPERNYGVYVKLPSSQDSCRLSELLYNGSDEEIVDDDDDDNTATTSDFAERVPDRDDIKSRSARIYSQAMLRKGYR